QKLDRHPTGSYMRRVALTTRFSDEKEVPMTNETLNVTVTYPAVGKPFHDPNANRGETLQSLKGRVLTAFGLKEGDEGGNQVTYVFFKGKDRLDDLSVTLGTLAGNAQALALKLSQQIVQGA